MATKTAEELVAPVLTGLPVERIRLHEEAIGERHWKRWGPYLSERQWGTVREDYSHDGNAWDYFSHEQSRSRAYRWGEDGIGGWCDDRQRVCVALAMWNGQDPILKERIYGLTNSEGNHGEDCKDLYFYLDATPTHSYLKMLYKYPQRCFPYDWLTSENRRRGKQDLEFEIVDTGIFDDNRYFDVFVEYAKVGPDDFLMLVTAHNRGPDAAPLHLLPQMWFRNTWSWDPKAPKPGLSMGEDGGIVVDHPTLEGFQLYYDGNPALLFCDNITNTRRLYGDNSAQGYFKDAFHDYVVHNNKAAVNPQPNGTKVAGHYFFNIPPGGSAQARLRLSISPQKAPFKDFDATFNLRKKEADEFYGQLQAGMTNEDEKMVQRQALAGMIWSKQFYHYDIPSWWKGDPAVPFQPPRPNIRNFEWMHLANAEVLSMPDKWEYPWYAAWDLAFHCIPLSLVDANFAKEQLTLLTRERYIHPNGQLPAYEWNFGDVNPPVHAWATWRVFQIDRRINNHEGDTWWVNRKDASGRNIFQGGFLGLDNIGVFDRSAPLPTGGYISQADGTAWMAMYSLNLMRIALELGLRNPVYQDVATKFFEHFLHIAQAMTNLADRGLGLWDEEDEFYYDVLNLPNGGCIPLKLRSMVGLIPLFAVETIEPEMLQKMPDFRRRLKWFLKNRPDLAALVSRWGEKGQEERRLLSLVRGHRMKRLLKRMLDETEFLSDYGVRAISRSHRENPYEFWVGGNRLTVTYTPAESDSGLFGGNSNWRGPIWFPVNYLLIESLQKFHYYYGDDFKIECPTGSGKMMTIDEVADELSRRLCRIFLKDGNGRRPVFGHYEKFQNDPHFRDCIPFHEYFDGDNGRGVGATHQTGWTGLVAKLLQPRRKPQG
jgi:hypothetical protein